MCLPAPLLSSPPAPLSATVPCFSDSTGFLSQTYVVLALFSHSEPLYLHISKGWSCHGVVPLPVTITVNMGAQCLGAIRFVHVLLYLNISLTPHPCPSSPLVPPLLPSLVLLSSLSPPSSIGPFFCKRGVKKTGVFELSVQYVSSLSPCSPCPLDCPRWVCFVQEVGTIDVSLYVPVEHLWLLSLAAVNKHVLVEDSETLSFLISLFSFYRLSILYVGVQKSFKSKHFYLYSSLSL